MSYHPDTMETASSSSGNEKHNPQVFTLDERRRAALADVDNAKFSWFHAKVCLVAGVGFFTDAYDIFAINIASTMLGYVYRANTADKWTDSVNQDLGIKVATPIGTFVGQLLFGWLADIVGRKKMYGVELMIIILGTFGQVLSGQAHGINIYAALITWRFIMGIGIGGDYPLSAVISSEFASTRIRGRMMTAVFSSQGWGQFTAALVSLIIVAAFKDSIESESVTNLARVDNCWRLLIGLGMVPAVIALYFRLTIPETPRFTMDIERNVQQATQDVDTFLTSGKFHVDPDAVVQKVDAPKATRRDFWKYFGNWKNGKVLLGTAYSWFALDIAFYGLGLNSSIVLSAINFGTTSITAKSTGADIYKNLHAISVGNIILSVGGLIPGYYATFFLIDRVGRKPIQLMGFAVLTVIFCAMGFGYHHLTNKGQPHSLQSVFVFLYCMANFFQNFGPNTTTFVVPGEAFPTRYRSTAHGISAASGKLGAIIAQVGFARLKDIGGSNQFVGHILEIFALFMLTGVFSTLLIPETMNRSLEELSNESQEGFIKGARRVETRDGVVQ